MNDYEFLNYVHPTIKEVSNLWEDIELLISGNRHLSFIARKHIRARLGESFEQYQDRLKRVTYSPVLSDTIRDLVKKLTTGSINVETPNFGDWVQTFDWVKLAGLLATDILTYGRVLLTIDEGGLKVLNPRQCVNYGEYEDGSKWYLLSESVIVSSSPFEKAKRVVKYYLIDNEQITTYSKNDGVISEETQLHGFNDTPIFYMIAPTEAHTASAALSKCIQHFVIENTIYEGAANLYVQRTFNKQLIPDDDLDDTYQLDTGNEHILLGDFQFSEAAGTSINTGLELLDVIKNEIKGIISTGSMSNSSKLSGMSGESRKFDYLDYSLTVANLGSLVLKAIREVLEWLVQTTGISGNVSASGFDIFEVDNLEYLLDVADRTLNHQESIDSEALVSWYSKISNTLSK